MQVRSLLVLLSVLAVVLVLPFAVLGQPQTDVGALHHQPQSEAASTPQATDPPAAPAVAPSEVPIAPPAPANPLDSRAGKLLNAFYTAYINGDSNTLLSHVDSGTVFEYNAPPLTPAHPAYGVYHGPEGWNQFLARYQRVFEVTSFVPEVIYGDDHSATSIVHMTFKCRNIGATTSADSIERWTFNGDKVAKASLHLPEAARVESACESDEAAWLREGITAGIAGDSSKLTVHPQATFVVNAPAEWNIAGKYDYTQFVQQVVQVVDTPDITFRILSSGNGTALVEFNYPKYSIRKGIDRSKFTARNVKAFAVYNLVKVETLVEVPQSAPPAVADSGLAGNVAPTPAHLLQKVGFQVSHLKYTIAGSDPVLKVKKAKAGSASADLAVEELVVEEKTKDKKAKKKAEKAQKKAKKDAKSKAAVI